MSVSPGRIVVACLGLGLLGLVAGLSGAEPIPRKDLQGDPLPPGARVRLGTARGRSSSPILFAAYLADGKELLTVHLDTTGQVSDAANGKELRRFGTAAATTTGTSLTAFAISADGKVLAMGGRPGTVTLWDLDAAKERATAKVDQTVGPSAVALSPDGKLLAARTARQGVRLFDTASGKELRAVGKADDLFFRSATTMRGATMAFSPDGKRLAVLGGETNAGQRLNALRLVDVDSGREVQQWRHDKAVRSTNYAACVMFTPDNRNVLWTNGEGGLSLTEAVTGKERRQFTPPPADNAEGHVCHVSTDGRLIAVRETLRVPRNTRGYRLWDLTSGKQLRFIEVPPAASTTLALFYASLGSFALSPDGQVLTTAGGPSNSRLQAFAVATGKERQPPLGHEGQILTMIQTADGKSVISCGADQAICQWDLATGKEVGRSRLGSTLAVNNLAAALSPDGKIAACAVNINQVRVMDAVSGKELHQIPVALPTTRTGSIGCLAFAPDGKILAILGRDQVVRLIDPVAGRELRQLTLPGGAAPAVLRNSTGLMFSPDGSLLAVISSRYVAPPPGGGVAGESLSLRLWDVARGKAGLTCDLGTRAATALGFSPDGHCLAVAYVDNTLSLWETATAKERCRFPALARPSRIHDIAFAPDGRTLVLGRADGSLAACAAGTGKEIKVLAGHSAPVTQLAFAPDGKSLLSGSMDTTLLLWDTKGISTDAQPAAMDLEEKQVAAHWAELAGEDAGKAFLAIRALAAAPRNAVPFLKDRLKPVAAPDPKELAQWLAELDDPEFATRQKAAADLERMGELAEPALRKALDDKPSLEMRRRLEQLLEKLKYAVPTGDELRNQRALEALEVLGTAEARQVIEGLAKGAAGARLTRAAAAAVHRLNLRDAHRAD